MLPRRSLPPRPPSAAPTRAEEAAPSAEIPKTTPTSDAQPTLHRRARSLDAFALLAGAPGTNMRRAWEVSASVVGGAFATGAAGGAATFWGGLPLLVASPALGARVVAITLGAALTTALPGAALGAAWTLDRPAFPGSRQAAAVMGAAIGLVAGWGYGRGTCSAIVDLWGLAPGSLAAETMAVVADLIGMAAALAGARCAGQSTWTWSNLGRTGDGQAGEARTGPALWQRREKTLPV